VRLENLAVEVKSIRRPNAGGVEPTVESLLAEGDVVVLLGSAASLIIAQNTLLIGRIANK